jgi:hypothetical protein
MSTRPVLPVLSLDDSLLRGACVGTTRFGTTVEFWCESLDGDSTDVRIVKVRFPSEEVAAAVAAAAAFQS